jgi:CheY-like chemotaxis protein
MAVDDEAGIAFTLKLVLEESGFLVDVFNDPKIALINFKPDYYDLILLDVKMPEMNGFELYQEIKKKDKVKACFVYTWHPEICAPRNKAITSLLKLQRYGISDREVLNVYEYLNRARFESAATIRTRSRVVLDNLAHSWSTISTGSAHDYDLF